MRLAVRKHAAYLFYKHGAMFFGKKPFALLCSLVRIKLYQLLAGHKGNVPAKLHVKHRIFCLNYS